MNSGDADRTRYALIDCSYDAEAAWVQARCLEGLQSGFPTVRGGAIIALQVLTAIRRESDPLVLVPAVAPLRHDPDEHVAWLAETLLNDLKSVFGQYRRSSFRPLALTRRACFDTRIGCGAGDPWGPCLDWYMEF